MQRMLMRSLVKLTHPTAIRSQQSVSLSSTANVYQKMLGVFKKDNPICLDSFKKNLDIALVAECKPRSRLYTEFTNHLKTHEIILTTSMVRKLLLNHNCIPAIMEAYPIIENTFTDKKKIIEHLLKMDSIQVIAFCHIVSLLDRDVFLTKEDVGLLFRNCHRVDWLCFNNFFEEKNNAEYRWTYIKRFLQNNQYSHLTCIIALSYALTFDELVYITENTDIEQLQDIQYIFSFNLSSPQKSYLVEVLMDHPQYISQVREVLESKQKESHLKASDAGNIIIGCIKQLLIAHGEPVSESMTLRKAL